MINLKKNKPPDIRERSIVSLEKDSFSTKYSPNFFNLEDSFGEHFEELVFFF